MSQIWENHKFIDFLDTKNNEIKTLPKGVFISTMCAKCKLNTNLDLNNIYNYLPLDSNDILTVKINKEKIRTLIPVKEKKRRTKKNTLKKNSPFYNQVTIVVRINEGECDDLNTVKKLNLKLFKNGSIQISGLKKVSFTNRALNKLAFRLSQIKALLLENEIREIKFIESTKPINIDNFSIYMINSNYKVNMMQKYMGAKSFGVPIETYITMAIQNGRTPDELGLILNQQNPAHTTASTHAP